MLHLVAMDFESFYSDDYSLSKMTIEAYVRDARFKPLCCGCYHATEGPISFRDVLTLGASNVAVVHHHAQFDGFILARWFGWHPAFFIDTLSMARACWPHDKSHSLAALAEKFGLPPKTVPYNLFKGKRDLEPETRRLLLVGAEHDAWLSLQIANECMRRLPREELKIIDATVRMFTEPVLRLNRPRLVAYKGSEQARKRDLLALSGCTEDQLQSSARFCEVLLDLGYEPPTKPSPTDPTKLIPALAKTDAAMRALTEHEDERVANLARARLGVKSTLGETRAERLLDMDTRGPLAIYLAYFAAHTSRFGGGDKLNWQNFPRGGEIRKSLEASPGHVLVVGDLSQIEARVLDFWAGQDDMVEAYRRGDDIYSDIATGYYGVPVTKADALRRNFGKAIKLSCGYGLGAARFREICRIGPMGAPPLIISQEEAQAAIDLYRRTHPQVVQLWRVADKMLKVLQSRSDLLWVWEPLSIQGGRVQLPNGLYLDYTPLELDEGANYYLKSKRGRRRMYGAKLVENLVQALARIILTQAALRCIERGLRLIWTVHDELIFVVSESQAGEARQIVQEELCREVSWWPGLPLHAEISVSKEYAK